MRWILEETAEEKRPTSIRGFTPASGLAIGEEFAGRFGELERCTANKPSNLQGRGAFQEDIHASIKF
jgi:hypothetical protein